MDLSCLDTIVGLSQTTCPCYENPPVGFNTSDSGLFIDEVKGFNKDIANFQDCQDDNIWGIMDDSRTRAISTFYSDYILCIQSFPKQARYDKCNGLFQDSRFDGTISTADDYVGIKFDSCELKGTQFIIRTIGFKPDTSGTVDIEIYSNTNLTTALFQDLGKVVVGGVMATSTVNTEFPLWDDGCIDLEYFVTVKLNGVVPQKNQIRCVPCSRQNRKCWAKFFEQKGVSGDDITDAENWTTTDDANGIVITGEVACRYDELICPVGGLNFTDPYDTMIATAIQYKSAELIYCKVLEGSNATRYNTIDADVLKERSEFYAHMYEEFKDWICANIPENNNYCLTCNDNRIVKQTMWS